MSTQQSTETDLYVDWQGYHRMIERLALQIYESGWHFDVVLCLARGGLVAGNVLCRIFDKPLAVLSTSSYREAIGTVQGALDIAKNITMTQGELSGSVLLVDDLIDTGVTLAAVKAHWSRSGTTPAMDEILMMRPLRCGRMICAAARLTS